MFFATVWLVVVVYLTRVWVKSLLLLGWRTLSNERSVPIVLAKLMASSPVAEIFPAAGIDVERRLVCCRGIIEEMKRHDISFRELGINPIDFWTMLKRLRQVLWNEVSNFFRRNYFGRALVKKYFATLSEVFDFIREQPIPPPLVPMDQST